MACVYYESIICCFVMQFQRSETATVGRDKLGVLGSPLRCNRSVVPLSVPSLSDTEINCYVHVRSLPPPPLVTVSQRTHTKLLRAILLLCQWLSTNLLTGR